MESAKKIMSEEKIQARIREWELRYGKIPTDATHIDMVGLISETDVKKIKVGHFEYWGGYKWHSCSVRGILNFSTRYASLHQAPSAVEAISEPHPRIAAWKAEFGPLPEGITHLHTGEFLNLSNAKKVRPDGVVCYWDGKWWARSYWKPEEIGKKIEDFVVIKPEPSEGPKMEDEKLCRLIDEYIKEHGSIPEGTTHFINTYRGNLGPYRINGASVSLWSESDGDWVSSACEPNDKDLSPIPLKYLPQTNPEADEKLCMAIDAWIKKHGLLPEGTTHFLFINANTPVSEWAPHKVAGPESKFWNTKLAEWRNSAYSFDSEFLSPLPFRYMPETKPGPDPEPRTTVKTIWYNGAKEPFSYSRLAEIIMENDCSNLEFSIPAPDHFGTGDPVMTVITEYLKRPVECCYFLYGKVHSGEIKIRRTTKLAPAPKPKADDFDVKNLASVSVLCWIAGNWREMPEVNERIFEWVKCYGKVPEDATHFFPDGSLVRSDIKKHKDGYVWSRGPRGWQKDFAFEGDLMLRDSYRGSGLVRINAEYIRYITKESQGRRAEPPITAADWVAESFINEPMNEILPKPVKAAPEPKPKVFPIAAMADQAFPCRLGEGYGS